MILKAPHTLRSVIDSREWMRYRSGAPFIHRNSTALPRARLAGHPVYVNTEEESALALTRLGPKLRDELVVEDPTHPLPGDVAVSGTAQIIRDLPEHVVVETEAPMPAYLVLADTFDPGWSATVERPASTHSARVPRFSSGLRACGKTPGCLPLPSRGVCCGARALRLRPLSGAWLLAAAAKQATAGFRAHGLALAGAVAHLVFRDLGFLRRRLDSDFRAGVRSQGPPLDWPRRSPCAHQPVAQQPALLHLGFRHRGDALAHVWGTEHSRASGPVDKGLVLQGLHAAGPSVSENV